MPQPVLVVIDVQERLFSAMDGERRDDMVRNLKILGTAARRLGVPVLLTHPGDNVTDAQYRDVKALGAFVEVNADFYQERDDPEEKIAFAVKQIQRLGAESIVMGTDCGQHDNPLPADCLALAARALRARGVTDRQLDLMVKENPARLLGLPPPASSRATASR